MTLKTTSAEVVERSATIKNSLSQKLTHSKNIIHEGMSLLGSNLFKRQTL